MKASDYIADFIAYQGTKQVFLITGGAITHIVDSVCRRSEETKDYGYTVFQHEQAGAMACEAYSRLGQGIGVMLATSGPGATNLITGMCGCWFDSVPGLFITGQVNTAESTDSTVTKPRQVGFQETDIVGMVKMITKYAEKVTDVNRLRYVLEKAVYMAKEGRPGPSLVDIPVNLQVADIDPDKQIGFDPAELGLSAYDSKEVITQRAIEVATLLAKAERPVLLLGMGVKVAKVETAAASLADLLNIPVLVTWSGFDAIAHTHPLFAGHIGVYGHRGANLAVQNCDLLISLGSRLDTRITGGDVKLFARAAKKVMVDIDAAELRKGRGLKVDVAVHASVADFIPALSAAVKAVVRPDLLIWRERVRAWFEHYPAVLPEYRTQTLLNAYVVAEEISKRTPEDYTTIVDEGGNLVWTMQSWQIKPGQKLISTFGNSPMGYALPAAIGATLATGQPVTCIDGDGGFQMNIQELQTVAHYHLPIRIILLNNRCMGIIKQFQDQYFGGHYYATSPEHGYAAPNFTAIAQAYGIPALTVKTTGELAIALDKTMSSKGPILVDIYIDEQQKLNPKLEFGRPLEDMAPYLSDEEFKQNMIIEPLLRDTRPSGWKTVDKE